MALTNEQKAGLFDQLLSAANSAHDQLLMSRTDQTSKRGFQELKKALEAIDDAKQYQAEQTKMTEVSE